MKKKTARLGSDANHIDMYISREHSFTTDSVLLAGFSGYTGNEPALDLGAGCGIIAFLWALKGGHISALEISTEAVVLMERTCRENRLGNVSVICGDIRQAATLAPAREAMLIACNPPYFRAADGRRGNNLSRERARSDTGCSLGDVAAAAGYLLHENGRLCLCVPPFRVDDLAAGLNANGLFITRIRAVHERAKEPARLLLVEARRQEPAAHEALPPLIARDENGGETAELKAIYSSFVDSGADE